MNATTKIKKALLSIMQEGEANACYIEKGYAYDGRRGRIGWHFTQFNGKPFYLGRTLKEALETIDNIEQHKYYDSLWNEEIMVTVNEE